MTEIPTDPSTTSESEVSAWTERLGLADKAVVTTNEAARVLRLSERSVRQAIKDGSLPCIRIGRRVLIPVPMLVSMLLGMDSQE